jgi:hypothetical protein
MLIKSNSQDQSPPGESDIRTACQETIFLWWNTETSLPCLKEPAHIYPALDEYSAYPL